MEFLKDLGFIQQGEQWIIPAPDPLSMSCCIGPEELLLDRADLVHINSGQRLFIVYERGLVSLWGERGKVGMLPHSMYHSLQRMRMQGRQLQAVVMAVRLIPEQEGLILQLVEMVP